MSILASPPLPCVGCGLPTLNTCQGANCDDPLCARCERRNRGCCAACAEARQALHAQVLDYERSVL